MKYDLNNDYTLDFNEVTVHLHNNSCMQFLYTAQNCCGTGVQSWSDKQAGTSGKEVHSYDIVEKFDRDDFDK